MTTTLSPGTYGPQTISSSDTWLSQDAQATTIIVDTGGFYTFGVNITASNAQLGDLSGDGFTIEATNTAGVAVQILGSNVSVEGNVLSANDSTGGGGGDLVTGAGANNLTVQGNTFNGVGNWLIYVNGALDTYTASTNVNITNNTFNGNATAGADISDDAASGTISGNSFSGTGNQAIFLGTVSSAVASYYNGLYGTTYTPVAGTITVSNNNFSGWHGADVSTFDANYTFAGSGTGVTLTDTVTASGQEIDKITGWTSGSTVSLDTGFDTALSALQNGKNEVDVFLSTGDEIIIQGNNVSASTIGAMLHAPVFQEVDIGSYTIALVGNSNSIVSMGSHDLVAIGNGTDSISVGSYDVVLIGNGSDLITGDASGNISNDIITIGNGSNDFLHAANNIDHSLIVFGNGTADHMTADNGMSNDIIIFGNGAEDSVITAVPPGDGGSITNSSITLGNGDGDFVAANVDLSGDSITLGSGAGDHVDAFGNINGSWITFGDVAGKAADNVLSLGNISGSEITFGNASGDNVLALATISGDAFNFGNGSGDSVTGSDGGNNKITLGNGSNDTVSLSGSGPGGDSIATGTGSGDMVTVGTHTNPDTFAFALGTNGTHYTTVSGAEAGDHVLVNGGQLGGTVVNEATADTSLASFISSLHTLTKGDTYVGYNTTANDTFIVTDTASGQTGAIELTNEAFQHSVVANHILTLHL